MHYGGLRPRFFKHLPIPHELPLWNCCGTANLPAGRLIERLGLEQANASQHFSVLRAKQIVVNRKEGNQVFYSLRSPLLIEVLDIMRRYFHEQLTETMAALGEIEKEQGEVR